MGEFLRRFSVSPFGAKMRILAHPALLAAVAAFALAIAIGARAQQSQPASAEKTAAQQFKNIQVLKDIPASQLIPGMRYITTALGVECNYCHVNGNFASDDKQPKQTARRMMTMLFAINNNNFGGRPEVSCFTCHQGHHEPMGTPALPAEAVEPQFSPLAAQGAPTVDAILAKFAQAKGGEDALQKINTRVIQLDETRNGQTSSITAYQKAPGEMYSVINGPQGNVTTFTDGMHAWVTTSQGSFEANGFDAIVLGSEAQMDPIAVLQNFKNKRLRGQAKIGDAMTYVVQATNPAGLAEFLFFDQQSGLLVRRSIRDRTIFGVLPVEADYSDFRPTDGVNIPYKIAWYTNGQTETFDVKDVKDNAPVDDSKFAPPQQKPQ
jgi:photosynthetic reaction center cytochrome c subunit